MYPEGVDVRLPSMQDVAATDASELRAEHGISLESGQLLLPPLVVPRKRGRPANNGRKEVQFKKSRRRKDGIPKVDTLGGCTVVCLFVMHL